MDFPGENEAARLIWNANAAFWDEKIGPGNAFQVELIEPATHRLLGVQPGQSVLDIGCGAGRFARQLAQRGACVVGIDFSEQFIGLARAHGQEGIEYLLADATDERQLLALGEGRFDAAVATMALMDMACLEPLLRILPRLLKCSGRFVFSIMHPCFQPGNSAMFCESTDEGGRYCLVAGVKVASYLTSRACKGIGIIGQPEPQHYFHRPLSKLLGGAFAAGFVMDGIEEPAFPAGQARAGSLRWRDLPEIPPILVARLRTAER